MSKFNTNSKFFRSLIFILSAHIYFLFLMFILRCLFFICNAEIIEGISSPNKYSYIVKAFIKGSRFDNMIVSYITILPLLIIPSLALFNIFNKKIISIARVYYTFCCFVLLSISVANIPYYVYFRKFIDSSVMQWIIYWEQVYGMLIEEKSNIFYFILFVILSIACLFFIFKLCKYILHKVENNNFSRNGFIISFSVLIVCGLLTFIGTKGAVTYSLKPVNAFFTYHKIINDGVVNPLFFITKVPADVYGNRFIEDIGDMNMVNSELGADIQENKYYAINDTLQNNPNIVLVFMESFASKYLEEKATNGEPITPYITELRKKSFYFTQLYTQGTHTNQAFTATMYGIPSVFSRSLTVRKPIQLELDMFQDEHYESIRKDIPIFHGFPNDLRNRGYYTQFFVTHTRTFDNLDFFTQKNGFHKLYGLEDYVDPKPVNIWGVSDGDLFDNALYVIDSVSQEKAPVFSTILTISNHPPYVYPEDFAEISPDNDKNALAYMDDCIRKFMIQAEKKSWYNNTVFIFLGDHGAALKNNDDEYNLPLSLFHVPLIIFSPIFDDMPKEINSLMGQVDIYPVVMSLLDKEPIYKTFGFDILSEEREYIYFSSDDKLGCISNKYFYNYDFSYDTEFLYKLDDRTKENIIEDNKAIADSMKIYAASALKRAKYILKNN